MHAKGKDRIAAKVGKSLDRGVNYLSGRACLCYHRVLAQDTGAAVLTNDIGLKNGCLNGHQGNIPQAKDSSGNTVMNNSKNYNI
jgi:hypothetical protein